MENKYQLYVVLDGIEYRVLFNDGSMSCFKEEAISWRTTMADCKGVEYIETDKGILAFKVSNIKSVFYLCKPV